MKHHFFSSLLLTVLSLTMWAAPAADVPFLRALDVEADNLHFTGNLNPADEESPMVQLTVPQMRALLPTFTQENYADEAYFPSVCLAGVARLAQPYTLLVFVIEEGDASELDLGVYDRQGKLVDYAACGETVEGFEVYADEAETRGVEYSGNSQVLVNASGTTITVKRLLGKYDFVEGDEETGRNYGRTHWEEYIDYVFTLSNAGHLTLKLPQRNRHDGDEWLQCDIVADLNYLSANQEDAVDIINAHMPDKANELVDGVLQAVLINTFNANPERLLYWLANHRDNNKRMLEVFESDFSDGLIPKFNLYKAIESLPDAGAHDYLMKVTGQWGPADAAG